MNRPHTSVILAMSADGKIADYSRNPARFPSALDQARLEAHLSRQDAALFGAATLRAYGTSLSIRSAQLLHQRQKQGLSPQPIQMVCSASGNLDTGWRFFRQPFPRWLLTSATGATQWREGAEFDRVLILSAWDQTLAEFTRLGIDNLAVLGGGELIASLLAVGAIDELYLTLCPVLIGGKNAPTPVAGAGFLGDNLQKLDLIEMEAIEGEIFLHYRLIPTADGETRSGLSPSIV
jgi:5-amino-6-(5-phosphoribosylamino)uracil reductase